MRIIIALVFSMFWSFLVHVVIAEPDLYFIGGALDLVGVLAILNWGKP